MFDDVPVFSALTGGVLIGLSATLLLVACGRIAGISGILNGVLDRRSDSAWRWLFLIGLVAGGTFHHLFLGGESAGESTLVLPMIVGGFLVGFGTRMGGGCTSGHGVCGLGRLSLRSLVATLVFVAAGMAIVYVLRCWAGGAG